MAVSELDNARMIRYFGETLRVFRGEIARGQKLSMRGRWRTQPCFQSEMMPFAHCINTHEQRGEFSIRRLFRGKELGWIVPVTMPENARFRDVAVYEALFGKFRCAQKIVGCRELGFLFLQHSGVGLVIMVRSKNADPFAFSCNNFIAEPGVRVRPLEHGGDSEVLANLNRF